MKKIYVCNDTITGIFSAIYDAWKEGREEKQGIERADSNVGFLYTFWSEPGFDASEYCEYSL